MARPGPIERLRRTLERSGRAEAARRLPEGYQRLGRVVLVRWPEPLRPEFPFLADELRRELGAATVARFAGPVEGEQRRPRLEILAGTETETEVLEDGVRYRFDAARILYSRGNRTERARMARMPQPSETVADLFAGIGYFSLPMARHARVRSVWAVEENPVSFRYLEENIRRNHLEGTVHPVLGDNRTAAIPLGGADRVLLGYLPDSVPWVPRALELLRPDGGWVHVHRITGSRDPEETSAEPALASARRAGRELRAYTVRWVKAYGPGREHVVVDLLLGGTQGPA